MYFSSDFIRVYLLSIVLRQYKIKGSKRRLMAPDTKDRSTNLAQVARSVHWIENAITIFMFTCLSYFRNQMII